jgi:hypothetical protein
MSDVPRKKSPRAPSIPLEEAIERVRKVYDRERLHAVPTDLVAQHIGYKSANNGSALSTLASLRYYGLMDRPNDGQMAVSKTFEEYKFAPEESIKQSILIGWLTTPPVFAELVEKYSSAIPSDATLRSDLIRKGFSPIGAESVISVFRKSAGFAGYLNGGSPNAPIAQEALPAPDDAPAQAKEAPTLLATSEGSTEDEVRAVQSPGAQADRIPVRLPGGRRAWLIIPSPFFSSDKVRLKAQIDLLLADDESAAA